MHRSPHKASLKAIITAAGLATALGLAAPAFAQDAPGSPFSQDGGGHGHHGGRHHENPMTHDLRQLDLSAAQQQSVNAAIKASEDKTRSDFQGLMLQRRTFEAATPGTAVFNAAYGSYAQAAAVAAQNRVKNEADVRTQIYGMLTSEQRSKLEALKSQREQRQRAR